MEEEIYTERIGANGKFWMSTEMGIWQQVDGTAMAVDKPKRNSKAQ